MKSNLCDPCSPLKTPGFPAVSEVIMLCGEERATRAMINEIDRRRILPYEDRKNPGNYFVGRYGDNGKIQEKTPDI